ncbi:MAG: pyruvate ferredoxin oxidoreductase subunit gamma [Pseudomonadota bacterium]
MIEIRFHGRGGQGAVTSAELLATAAIDDGKFAQGFPSFGPERRGAPVAAFVRVSDSQIRLREKVYEPDISLVLDPTILPIVNVAAGLRQGGIVLINSNKAPEEIRQRYDIKARLGIVDATTIAKETLGIPVTNTTMLGSLIRATGIVSRESLYRALEHRFGRLAARNIKALDRAYDETRLEES